MKRILASAATAFAFTLAVGCGDASKYNPPSDHTNSQEGAMHKPGFRQPTANCTQCHGTDLKGGTSGVSCFECHGQEW